LACTAVTARSALSGEDVRAVRGAPKPISPVAADPERLHQILDNLLDNAVKYAAEGTEIRISALANISGVETVVANATNAHQPDAERMFERFYRADPSRSAAAGGVGLGLAISRELASAMRGKMWADYDDAGNLRLHLLLPAAPKPAPAVEQVAITAQSA